MKCVKIVHNCYLIFASRYAAAFGVYIETTLEFNAGQFKVKY